MNCGRPEADFNSVVYGNDWWVGSVVRYACRPGFLLLGDPASACQADGRWTPKPSCLRECRAPPQSGLHRGEAEKLERSPMGVAPSRPSSNRLLSPPSPAPPGICLWGRVEINEQDIDGHCSSSCTGRTHAGAALAHGCVRLAGCVTKQSGWARWFVRCDVCECDCYIPCGTGRAPGATSLSGPLSCVCMSNDAAS